MRVAPREDPIRRRPLGVAVDGDPGLLQRQRHVGLAHPEDGHVGVPLVLDQEVEQRLDRVRAAHQRHLGERLPLVLPELGVVHRSDQYRLRTRDLEPAVVPARVGALDVAPDPAPGLGIAQAREQPGGAAVVGPGRHERGERVEPGGIGVGVGGDVHPGPPGGVDLRHDLGHPAPVVLPGGLEVPDLDRNSRLAPDPDRLVQRGHDLVALVPEVRRIDPAEPRGLPRQRHELRRLGVGRRRVLERGREPHRAVPHRLAHQLPHPVQLGRRRVPVVVAQHHPAHLRGAHVGRQVDADALPLQAGVVLRQRPPVGRDADLVVARAVRLDDGVIERSRRPAFPGDLGGDALEDLGGQAGVRQDAELRLPQHVDEPRRHHVPPRVHHPLGLRALQPPDGRDPAVPDAEVRRIPGRAGAVDDPAVADDEIEGGGLGRERGDRCQAEEEKEEGFEADAASHGQGPSLRSGGSTGSLQMKDQEDRAGLNDSPARS